MTLTEPKVRLTEWTSCGGCAAKWGASLLGDLVAGLADGSQGPEWLAALAPSDDAAVVRLSDTQALVSTTDFFPPLVDDPADFGAIAAANACSDVFAMGGRVLVALNIAAFPEALPGWAIAAVLQAAAETVQEAGGVVAGGHTIRSEEPIFGLAVQGLVHPDRLWRKGGAQAGDVLLLSKPLGSGLVLAGGSDDDKAEAIAGMRRLNRDAAGALGALPGGPHAVTDVTGFGLAGHGWEMAERSGARMVFESAGWPVYSGAREAAEAGTRTGGDPRNREHVAGRAVIEAPGGTEGWEAAVAFDPQTSGGLLAAVAPSDAAALEARGFTRVGMVEAGESSVVIR
jgi:selenide, water dikinase